MDKVPTYLPRCLEPQQIISSRSVPSKVNWVICQIGIFPLPFFASKRKPSVERKTWNYLLKASVNALTGHNKIDPRRSGLGQSLKIRKKLLVLLSSLLLLLVVLSLLVVLTLLLLSSLLLFVVVASGVVVVASGVVVVAAVVVSSNRRWLMWQINTIGMIKNYAYIDVMTMYKFV